MDQPAPSRRSRADRTGAAGRGFALLGDPRLGSALPFSHRLYPGASDRQHGEVHQGRSRGHPGQAAAGPRQTRYVYVRDPEPLVQLRGQLRNRIGRIDRRADVGQARPETMAGIPAAAGRRRGAADGKGTGRAVSQVPRGLHAAGVAGPRRHGHCRGLRPLRGSRAAEQTERQERPGKSAGNRRLSRRASRAAAASSADQRGVDRRRHGDLRRPAQTPAAFAGGRPPLRLDQAAAEDDEADADPRRPIDQGANGRGRARRRAEVQAEYAVGQVLAKAGEPLDNDQIDLLRLEYTRAMEERPLGRWPPAPPPSWRWPSSPC